MPRATLLLGSNQGDRETILLAALREITMCIGKIEVCSSVYRSEPWGYQSENEFLNQAIAVNTDLTPLELLHVIQLIEKSLGREKISSKSAYGEKIYHDRTIDIDMIFYDDMVMESGELTIPHPLVAQRKFALEPLVEIMPSYIHPVLGTTVRQMLDRLTE